jgi:hypothetical protein
LSSGLVAEEAQNDADGFFSHSAIDHSAIDAGFGSQPSNQFVHIAPAPQPVLAGFLPVPCLRIDLERL